MNILDSSIYTSDIKRVINSLVRIKLPYNKTFFVTGATGLICSAVVDILEMLCISEKLNWKIILAVRNIQKAEERFRKYSIYNNISYFEYDVSKSCDYPDNIDYIIHGASNAYPAVISKYPMETLVDSIIGFERILRYAALYGKRVLYISSSEVYGRLNNAEPIKENEYGYIDILNSRSSYSMGKRAAETLSSSFISEFGVDSVIVRPGHIYGPTASIADNRVSSMFMYAAAKGQNLVLKSSGEQLRSYCYCLDCASAIVSVLFQGISGEAYNISNRASVCTIKEMAEQFAIVGNVELKFDTPSDKEKVAFNPMMNSSLDSNKLEALGWNAVFSKNEGFEHSVLICKEIL